MRELINIRQTKIAAAIISVLFLVIHVGMFLLFYQFRIRPMMIFNIFSILFYVLMLVPIYFGRLKFFTTAIYIEVIAHMSAAIYFTGWDNGFQITMIGMNVVLFFAEYLYRHLRLPNINAAPISAFGMIAYLGMCVVSYQHPAPYSFPPGARMWLQVFWGVIVFLIMNSVLYTFAKLSSGVEELLFSEVGHDQLTGLPNRYDFMDRLTSMKIGRSLNKHWLAMMDIDDFKQINDTYGHNCGDYVLKELSKILTSDPSLETVCRWGGEEFLILGTYEKESSESVKIAEDLRIRIAKHHFVYHDHELPVTVTLGIAPYQSSETLLEWVHSADEKLYYGKRSGKNQTILTLDESHQVLDR